MSAEPIEELVHNDELMCTARLKMPGPDSAHVDVELYECSISYSSGERRYYAGAGQDVELAVAHPEFTGTIRFDGC